jgi:hypothetical protein
MLPNVSSSTLDEKGKRIAVTPATQACRASDFTREVSDLRLERTHHILCFLIDEAFKSVASNDCWESGVRQRPIRLSRNLNVISCAN